MDILAKLSSSASTRRTVAICGVTLSLRILTERDYAECGFAAHEKFDDQEISASNVDLFEAEKSNQLLARALLDPATGRPVFKDAAHLAEILIRPVRQELIGEYLDFEQEFSPANISDAELSALIDEVKKKPAMIHSLGLGSSLLKKLVHILVEQPATSPLENGSMSLASSLQANQDAATHEESEHRKAEARSEESHELG